MTDVPFLKRKTQHRIGKSGRKSEVRLTRQLGGRARPASGAMEGAKGDIDLGEILLEAKSTTGASIGVKHSWLAKIGKEARSEGKMPALALSYVNEDGSPVMDGEWVCIPLHKFKELLP
jgi:hypothetical protein